MKRFPWIDALAALPVALLALLASDLIAAMATLDPLVVFRLLLLLWVLSHIVFNVGHLIDDIRGVREFLRDLEKSDPRLRGVAATGDRAFLWAVARVTRLAVGMGWPSLLLAALVVAVNTAAWLVLAGWRPEFLRGAVWK